MWWTPPSRWNLTRLLSGDTRRLTVAIDVPAEYTDSEIEEIRKHGETFLLRTVESQICNSYRTAFLERVLVDDDALAVLAAETKKPLVRASVYGTRVTHEMEIFGFGFGGGSCDKRRPVCLRGVAWLRGIGKDRSHDIFKRWLRMTRYTCLDRARFADDRAAFFNRMRRRRGGAWRDPEYYNDEVVDDCVWIDGQRLQVDRKALPTLRAIKTQLDQVSESYTKVSAASRPRKIASKRSDP